MVEVGDHPEVAAALETGYPSGAAQENGDTAEAKREYAEEHINDFIAFALAGDGDILDRFAEHYRWAYIKWLN